MLSYLDFDIEILALPNAENRYVVSVLHSPAGEIRQVIQFPFSDIELDSQLKDVKIALLKSTGGHRLAPSPEETVAKDFGKALFNSVMSGEIRALYDSSQARAAAEEKGLRVKMRIKPPKLAVIPWEFMYDYRRGEYVCLSSNTPVVRYIEVAQPVSPIAISPPLKILGMISSPVDLPALDIVHEKKRVEQSIRPLKDKALVELTWLAGATWHQLQRAMRTGTWHIFHFIGHGAFDRKVDEGIVCLEDINGNSDLMRATQLGRLLADHSSMRLVVLNSCEGASGGQRDIFSSTASILVRRGIPAVLAMQYDISDKAAIEFSTNFYEALADGMPVDAATTEARKAISFAIDDSLEWATPVLFMRSQDGVLFNFHRTVAPLPPLFNIDEKVTKKNSDALSAHTESHLGDEEKATAEPVKKEKPVAAEFIPQKPVAPSGGRPSLATTGPVARPTPVTTQTASPTQSRRFLGRFMAISGLLVIFVLGLIVSPMIRESMAPPTLPTIILMTEENRGSLNENGLVYSEIPTNALIATLPLSPIPTLPSPIPIPELGPAAPADFVVFYFYQIIYQKNYDLGWSLLTDDYKIINELNKSSYDETWSKTTGWEYSNFRTQRFSDTRTIVTLTATFYYTSGNQWTPPKGLTYCMVRDESRNTWMIDTKRNCGLQ
jgi:hypothetical protein